MESNNQWAAKEKVGDFHQRRASIVSRKIGSPKDFAVWGIITPDCAVESEMGLVYYYRPTIGEIMPEAQTCSTESNALELVIRKLTEKQVPWSFIFVAPCSNNAQDRQCVEELYFEDMDKFSINIYIGS